MFNSLLSKIKKNSLLNLLSLSFLIYFIYSYFLKLNYVLDIDEYAYLLDSLLVIEGMRPTMSHSPSGISTWLGSAVVLTDFIINNFSFHSLQSIFENFDLTLFKHYKNLTYIKISLFSLNTLLLIYLYYLDKKKIFFLSFFTLFLFPGVFIETFAGKPYFLASVFFIISLFLNDRNRFLSLVFYALAISEKIEFIVLINFICLVDNKFSFKSYLTVFIIFLVLSPWFSSALIQNAKVVFTGIYNMTHKLDQNSLLSILTYISVVGFIIVNFTYSFIRNNKIRTIYLLLLILILLELVLIQKMPIRWIMPGFIVLVYQLHFYLLKKEQLSKIGLILAVFLLLTNFNIKKFQSEEQILKREISSSYTNVIGNPLLREELNFKNYNQLFGSHLRNPNIKNINFFRNSNSPLAFGKSGNIELRFHRRYEFLSKYGSDGLPNKYIAFTTGLNWSAIKWCSILNKKDTTIILPYKNKITNCEDIN